MPDEPHLFEYLTVEEHLRLMARLYGVDDFDRASRALIDELELGGKERSLPGELSRGMRQKVVIACGLVRQASVLLFDEPLTGLDPLGIRKMRETIVARGRAGAAILLSSHLLHLVEEVCTRVDHHGPREEDRRRHRGRAGVARRSGRRRVESRTDLPARDRRYH